MKFAIVFFVIALATLAYSQPITDIVNHPSPPVKKHEKPTVLNPFKELVKQNISKPAKEHASPAAPKPAKEPAEPVATKPVKEPVKPPVLMPVTDVTPEKHNEKPQKPESIINIIIEHHRPKPEVDYFNGKIVPTPKYPSY